MRALLDTHVLLWWLADHRSLSAAHRALIADPQNELFVSSVTVAEIAVKASLGKLHAPTALAGSITASGFRELPLTSSHAEALRTLPWHHRDPFDRMLVAQAMIEQLTLVTADEQLHAYPVTCV
jgi:PIN domain nuclease of toxin-antitoxin system